MAGYRATIEGEVLKRHRCVGCSATFHYPLRRKGGGQAPTAPAAEKAARTALALQLMTEVDAHPCPGCGIYQPEMVARLRAGTYGFIAFFAHAAPLVLVALAAFDNLSWHLAAWGATGSGVLALLVHLRAATLRPNANLEVNRRKAEHEVAKGKLFTAQQGTSIEPAVRPGQGELEPGHKLALALFAAAVLALPSAEAMRLARGWPLNPDWSPGVVGPGDSAVLYFTEHIGSIAGHWSGNGGAQSLPPAQPALFKVTSKQDSWGHSIRAKSSETNSSSTPWAKVYFDEKPELAGQTLPLRVELSVRYPAKQGAGFATQTRTLAEMSEVRFAPAGAGKTYWQLLLGGLGGGAVLLAILGIVLVKKKHELGAPSETEILAKAAS